GVRDIFLHCQNGRGEVWLNRGDGAVREPEHAFSSEEVRALAVALINAGGRHIDELTPSADVHLGAGIRVHALLAPLCATGAVISIRIPHERTPTFAELVREGLCSPAVADRLGNLISTRRNFLITGATGSGKTTLLAALLELVPP